MNSLYWAGPMLKKVTFTLVMMIFFLFPQTVRAEEMKATWISYLDWETLPAEKAEFESAVDVMMENCRMLGLNTVFVHAHSHSDSYYSSSAHFPASRFISGVQGTEPGYDPFGYMVESAHAHGLAIHAWFNPYRVTGYLMSWDEVSDASPVKQWWNSADQKRNVLYHKGQYYLNPSRPEVRERIVASVAEVVRRYEVDGIQFDDYFYPSVNDAGADTWFDKPEYHASGSGLPIAQWRRDNVSSLLAEVKREIKSIKSEVVFGVSPQGYVGNLRSDSQLFTDIDLWLSSDQYVDYIMPQLYWGFEAKRSDGTPAPYAFEENLSQWIGMTSESPVKLYLGLGLYKGGSALADGNQVSEWLRSDDIIAREVIMARATGKTGGYSFYAYKSFLEGESRKEAENLKKVLASGQ